MSRCVSHKIDTWQSVCLSVCLSVYPSLPSGCRFPKDEQQHSKWVIAVNRLDPDNTAKMWKPGRTAVLCSKHFLPDDFLNYGERRRLKENVVPTIFHHKVQHANYSRT